jgi:flagellar basal body-associated protein FliL
LGDHPAGHVPAMLTILLIVLIVLLLTGGVGYGYRGRRRL